MQSVGASFQSDIGDHARLPTVFGLGILLDVELLDGINGEQRCGIAGDACRINSALGGETLDRIDAVQDVDVVFSPQAVGTLAPFSSAGVGGDSWTQLQEAQKISAVQRKVIDNLIAERAAQHGAGGVDQPCLFSHGDGG